MFYPNRESSNYCQIKPFNSRIAPIALRLLLLCALLSGCASAPQLNNLAADTDRQVLEDSKYFGAVSLGDIQVEAKANPVVWGDAPQYSVSPESLSQAVELSLGNARLLSSPGEASPFSLDVRFLYSEATGEYTIRVNSVILFSVTAQPSSENVFTELITGTHERGVLDTFSGAKRRSVTYEESVRDSLTQFVNLFLETSQ